MFRKIASITLLILTILLIIRETMEIEDGVIVDDESLEIRAGGMNWFVFYPSDLASDNESVEIQLDIRHVSGGKAQVLIVDKENFKKAENSPCWKIITTATNDIVCTPDYKAISPELSLVDFQGEETTDWINVGHQTHLYLLVTNINNHEILHIEVEAKYRQAVIDDDTF